MAKTSTGAPRRDSAPQREEVSDQVVSQVGRAAAQMVKLRVAYEQSVATAGTDEERENHASDIADAAVRVISEQGLTVDLYNKVIEAAQADPDLEERVMVACRAAA
jgi:hypothetical protein